ncbi:XrtA system polysaccharide deacetylase [candidate division KSB1 bacterium]
MNNIFSIDVEEWFHILEVNSSPDLMSWDNQESRIEVNFMKLLDALSGAKQKATCFFLGWIAEKYPHLVKEAISRGHEIASHGFAHQLIYTQTPDDFFEDIYKTKKLLEDITGKKVIGYRAPGFSITRNTIWAFEKLIEAGYKYDSSLFPAKRGHGYFLNIPFAPHKITLAENTIYEFPITVVDLLGTRLCYFGGGYLRLFPLSVIGYMARRISIDKRPVIYYIHPREIDVKQPRMNMGIMRKFKSYVNIGTTGKKIENILSNGEFSTFENFLDEYKEQIDEFELDL